MNASPMRTPNQRGSRPCEDWYARSQQGSCWAQHISSPSPTAMAAQPDAPRQPDNHRLLAYTVTASAKAASALRAEHYDISAMRSGFGNKLELEVIMTEAEAAKARRARLHDAPQCGPGDRPASRRAARRGRRPSPRPTSSAPIRAPVACARRSRRWPAQYPDITDLAVDRQTRSMARRSSPSRSARTPRPMLDGVRPSVVYVVDAARARMDCARR